MNIVKAFPDEHVWSVAARSIKWSGFNSSSIFNDKFGIDHSHIKPTKGDCHNITTLAKFKDFEQLQKSGSSFLLWHLNFDSTESANSELNCVEYQQARESQLAVCSEWKFCPCCAEENRASYGTAYWHNKHNLPFVTHCTNHNMPLSHVANLKDLDSLIMPNRLVADRIQPQQFGEEFFNWSRFVERIFNMLKQNPSVATQLRQKIWSRLNPVPNEQKKRRNHFNNLLNELEAIVPNSILRHCFQFYRDEKRRKSNILFTTYKRDGIQVRNPVYMLIILYWIELEDSSIFGDLHETTNITGNPAK